VAKQEQEIEITPEMVEAGALQARLQTGMLEVNHERPRS
jgi:hypothetical protein